MMLRSRKCVKAVSELIFVLSIVSICQAPDAFAGPRKELRQEMRAQMKADRAAARASRQDLRAANRTYRQDRQALRQAANNVDWASKKQRRQTINAFLAGDKAKRYDARMNHKYDRVFAKADKKVINRMNGRSTQRPDGEWVKSARPASKQARQEIRSWVKDSRGISKEARAQVRSDRQALRTARASKDKSAVREARANLGYSRVNASRERAILGAQKTELRKARGYRFQRDTGGDFLAPPTP